MLKTGFRNQSNYMVVDVVIIKRSYFRKILVCHLIRFTVNTRLFRLRAGIAEL